MEIAINPVNQALQLRLTAADGWHPGRQFPVGSLADDIADRVAADGNEANVLRDLLEPHWTNNGFEPFDAGLANPFVGLTEAPCIAEHALMLDDDGKRHIQPGDRVWWYPGYGLRNPLNVLLQRGEVIFDFGFTEEGGAA